MTFILDAASVTRSTLNTSTNSVGGITTLNGLIDDVVTTIDLTDSTEFPASGTIEIDNEYITYTSNSSNQLTGCVRGAFGSTATSHTNGSTVTGVFVGQSELNAQPNVATSLFSSTAGTEYYQFSNDNSTWSQFPALGYTITANTHEFQTAVKLARYFRVIFINGSSLQATFYVYTYYGQFGQPQIPLDQSITSDATSVITRAVSIGQNPLGTYDNFKSDGYAFQTTTPLLATTLVASTDAVQTTIYSSNTQGFSSSGTILIGSERITYSGLTTYSFTGCARGVFGTSASSQTDGSTITQVIGYTALSSNIDNSVTTIPVNSTTGFLSVGTILIGTERITYTGITSNTFTGATRGANSTVATSHNSGDTVSQVSSTNMISGGDLNSSATTITVMSTTGFPTSGIVLIDYEYIRYTGTTGTTFTGCVRGSLLSNATTHTNGTTITQVIGKNTINLTNPSYLNSTETTITVFSASGFPSSGNIKIDSEIINYTGTTSTTFTGCTRGFAGTTAESHTNVAYVDLSLETSTLQSLSDSATSIVLSDSTGFASSGIILIGSEQITYSGISTNTLTGCARGANMTSAISHLNGSTVSEGYESNVLSTLGYSQVQAEITSDVSGIIYGYWYSNETATQNVRIFEKPYILGESQSYLSAPIFSPYCKYLFFPYSTQTDLSFGLKFITKSISGQILGLSDYVPENLVANLSRTVLTGQTDSGYFKNVPVTNSGHLEVAINGPLNPFGSVHTENYTPVFQLDAVYGINTNNINPVYTGSGNATTSDGVFLTYSGTQIYSQAVIQSKTKIRYRPGQGIIAYFTGVFSTGPVAQSYQIVGIGTAEDGVYFGYVNTQFGILYTNRGLRRIQTLTITSNTAGAIVNIVLNSATAVSITLSTTTTTRSAWEISQGVYPGWDAQAIGNTVVFLSISAATLGGTYSATAMSGTFVGTFVATRVGSAAIEQFIPQSSWNIDRMDGSGGTTNPSNVTADWQLGNVFKISIQYLGFGTITFEVETSNSADSGTFIKVHTIDLPNTLTTTSFRNPTFPYTQAVYSAGSTTNLVVKSGSISAFNEGTVKYTANKFTYFASNVSAITSTTFANAIPLISIQNGLTYNGIVNLSSIKLVSLSVAVRDGSSYNSSNTKVGATVFLLKNPTTLTGPTNFVAYSSQSVSYVDTSSTGFTSTNNSNLIYSLSVAANSNEAITFTDDILLQPGDFLTIVAMSLGGAAGVVAGDLQITLNTRENT